VAGTYTLSVRGAKGTGSEVVPGSCDLVIRQKVIAPLNFAGSLNGNGDSHVDSQSLLDGQKNFYRVDVPALLDGEEIIGWKLEVAHTLGDTTLKVYPDFANPDDKYETIYEDTALIVPPYLTPGTTWYVEVVGNGLTDYTITSSPVTLEHAAWAMPLGYNSEFGDSGEALSGDQGIDLGEDDWHFYAIDVPEGNGGLLRTELQAINGDPQLYIGERGMPGIGYDGVNYGSGGIRCDHQLNRTGTEYGNWVPGDGRTERQLSPGRWFLAVRANSSNVRYRLLLSTGDVQELDLSAGTLTGQILKGEDWRYYRVTVPEDAPMNWTMNFTQQIGDVVMHVRDSVPPGQRGYNFLDQYFNNVWNAYA